MKHADARHVTVVIDHRATELVMVVEDDGAGIETTDLDHSAGVGKLGLHGIRERVTLLRGELSLESPPGGGTTLFVKVPLSETTRG